MTKRQTEETINQAGRATYPDEKSVLRNEATRVPRTSMPRVSSSRRSQKPDQDKAQEAPPARRYVAKTDYGTRGSERNKKLMRFGKYRFTLYRRSDVAHSSWFLRIHLTKEGRH